jgi:hypothetical protein
MAGYAERIEITANREENENAKSAKASVKHSSRGLRKAHQRMLMGPHHKTCGEEPDEVERVRALAQSTPHSCV